MSDRNQFLSGVQNLNQLGAGVDEPPRNNVAAFVRAVANGGHAALMEPGTYIIDSTVVMADDVTIEVGAGVTVDASAMSAPCFTATSKSNVRLIGDGKIVCAAASVPSFTNCTGLSVDVRIEDAYGHRFGAMPYLRGEAATKPWRVASWGDSRANVNSSVPDVAGTTGSFSPLKTPAWLVTARDDFELAYNFGVSGDSASLWDATTRTGGKTIAAICACDAEVVDMHIGVNDLDAWNGVSPTYADQITTTANDIIAALRELVKHGKLVILHAIMPQTSTGWGTNAALKQEMADAVNVLLRAEVATISDCAVFVDSTSWAKDSSTGYASATWYVDDTHVNINGAMREGADGAEASYAIIPSRNVRRQNPNLLNYETPALATNADSGTITFSDVTNGTDTSGQYTEYTLTATALASGEAVANITVMADVGAYGGAAPAYFVEAGDYLQGRCRLVVDDGAGGAPAATNPIVRHRIYYQAGSSSYADWGNATLTSGYPALYKALDGSFHTPKIFTTTASPGIEASTIAKGYGLVVRVALTATDTPVRVRIYNPVLAKTGPQPGKLSAGCATTERMADGRFQTIIEIDTTLPAIAGGANLAVGKLLYTLPDGVCLIESASMSVGITQTQGNITADTPDVGLGTVIASGAVALLSGTATFENILTGQTAANCSGSRTVATTIPTAGVPFVIASADARTVYLNVADGWAASGDAAALLKGRVVLNWRHLQ